MSPVKIPNHHIDWRAVMRQFRMLLPDSYELRRLDGYQTIAEAVENESKFTIAHWVCAYAENVVHGRWIEAEWLLEASPRYSYQYLKFLQKRIPTLESVILQDSYYAARYAKNVLHGTWEAAEPDILKNPHALLVYCRYVKGDWQEARQIMLDTGPRFVFEYIHHVLNDQPWPEGALVLQQSARYARLYALYVLKGPFREAEKTIEGSPTEWKLYLQFLKRVM